MKNFVSLATLIISLEVEVIMHATLKSERFRGYFMHLWNWGTVRGITWEVLSESFCESFLEQL